MSPRARREPRPGRVRITGEELQERVRELYRNLGHVAVLEGVDGLS